MVKLLDVSHRVLLLPFMCLIVGCCQVPKAKEQVFRFNPVLIPSRVSHPYYTNNEILAKEIIEKSRIAPPRDVNAYVCNETGEWLGKWDDEEGFRPRYHRMEHIANEQQLITLPYEEIAPHLDYEWQFLMEDGSLTPLLRCLSTFRVDAEDDKVFIKVVFYHLAYDENNKIIFYLYWTMHDETYRLL